MTGPVRIATFDLRHHTICGGGQQPANGMLFPFPAIILYLGIADQWKEPIRLYRESLPSPIKCKMKVSSPKTTRHHWKSRLELLNASILQNPSPQAHYTSLCFQGESTLQNHLKDLQILNRILNTHLNLLPLRQTCI